MQIEGHQLLDAQSLYLCDSSALWNRIERQ